MRPELKAKILAYNQAVKDKKEKAADLEVILAAWSHLPPGQQKKLLTEEILAVLAKYGYYQEVL